MPAVPWEDLQHEVAMAAVANGHEPRDFGGFMNLGDMYHTSEMSCHLPLHMAHL